MSVNLCPICREPLDHEAEIDAGSCFCCQASEAGFQMPESRPDPVMSRAVIEDLCGVTHRRRAS